MVLSAIARIVRSHAQVKSCIQSTMALLPGSPPENSRLLGCPMLQIFETLEIFRRKKTQRDSFPERVCETQEGKRILRLTHKTISLAGRVSRAKLGRPGMLFYYGCIKRWRGNTNAERRQEGSHRKIYAYCAFEWR